MPENQDILNTKVGEDDNVEVQENAEQDPLTMNAKSSVKIIKNSKSVNWEVKVVSGEEHLIDELCQKALDQHHYLNYTLVENADKFNKNSTETKNG